MKIIKKLKNGEIKEILAMLENFDKETRTIILKYNNYDLYPSVINYLKYEQFMQIVELLPEEKILDMACSNEGLTFRVVVVNEGGNDLRGVENKVDFTLKTIFFLRLDKNFFINVFFQKTSKCFITDNVRKEFMKIVEDFNKENEISEKVEKKIKLQSLSQSNEEDNEKLEEKKGNGLSCQEILPTYPHIFFQTYWEQGIIDILKLRLVDSGLTQNIFVSDPFLFSCNLLQNWNSMKRLESLLFNSIKNKVMKTILPINLDNVHWVGMLFEMA